MVRVMVKIFLAPKIEKMTLTSTKLFLLRVRSLK